MAKNRSRRLRKKLRVDEFQEIGFNVNFSFPAGTEIEQIDHVIDTFIDDLIEPNGLTYGGYGYLDWEGIVALKQIGKCTDEHRQLVEQWLAGHGVENLVIGELYDIWWE